MADRVCLRSHWALEMPARACLGSHFVLKWLLGRAFEAIQCSKWLLERAFEATWRSKWQLGRAFKAIERSKWLPLRVFETTVRSRACSSLLLQWAFKMAVRACRSHGALKYHTSVPSKPMVCRVGCSRVPSLALGARKCFVQKDAAL